MTKQKLMATKARRNRRRRATLLRPMPKELVQPLLLNKVRF